MDLTAILAAAIAGLLSGFGTALLTARSTAARSLSQAAGELAQAYQAQLRALREDLAALEARLETVEAALAAERERSQRMRLLIYALLAGIKTLLEQLRRKGLVPAWCPPTEEQIATVLGEDKDGDHAQG